MNAAAPASPLSFLLYLSLPAGNSGVLKGVKLLWPVKEASIRRGLFDLLQLLENYTDAACFIGKIYMS
uniref:Uncharacterized protein n=1 Tax=Aegilops tauschii TaxID=37682 RepID=M8BIA5_AEGTA